MNKCLLKILNLKISETIFLDPNRAVEIRRIEIENLGNQDDVFEKEIYEVKSKLVSSSK